MGNCISCRVSQVSHNGSKDETNPSIAPIRPGSRPSQRQHEDVNEDSSVSLSSKQEACSSQASLSTLNESSLRSHWGRQKMLSICATYSEREKLEIPKGLHEDCVLSIHDLYNILNDGSLSPFIHNERNLLLIDCRDAEEYEKLHIITAEQVDELQHGSFQIGIGYSMYIIVIIYGVDVKRNLMHGKMHDIWSEIFANARGEVLVLSNGFDAFYKKFPFLCTDKPIRSIWERRSILTYPSAVINDKLYQGTGEQAANRKVLDDLKITHIVNITKEHPNRFGDEFVYLRLALEDEKQSNLKAYFEETCDFISEALKKSGCVLVHSNLGVSRSSTVVLAYLMKTQKISLDKALTFLRSRRSCARPNMGFLSQLSDWEVSILGKKVTNIDKL